MRQEEQDHIGRLTDKLDQLNRLLAEQQDGMQFKSLEEFIRYLSSPAGLGVQEAGKSYTAEEIERYLKVSIENRMGLFPTLSTSTVSSGPAASSTPSISHNPCLTFTTGSRASRKYGDIQAYINEDGIPEVAV